MSAESLLRELRGKGVTFGIEPGRGLCFSVPGNLCNTDVIDRITQNKPALTQAVAAETGQKVVTTRSGSSAGQRRDEIEQAGRELADAVAAGQRALLRIDSLEGTDERSSARALDIPPAAFMG